MGFGAELVIIGAMDWGRGLGSVSELMFAVVINLLFWRRVGIRDLNVSVPGDGDRLVPVPNWGYPRSVGRAFIGPDTYIHPVLGGMGERGVGGKRE